MTETDEGASSKDQLRGLTGDFGRAFMRQHLVHGPLYVSATQVFREDPPCEVCVKLPEVLHRHCDKCSHGTSFRLEETYEAPGYFEQLLVYRCPECASRFVLWLEFERKLDTTKRYVLAICLRKLGQDPSSAQPDREVDRVLSEESKSLFRRGLANIGHGYGLGALAYFRRVVEIEVEHLLKKLLEPTAGASEQVYRDRVVAALRARAADDRLRLAADAAPSWLRVGGQNPLKRIYDLCSEGIHGSRSEDESLALAQQLRILLESVLVAQRGHEKMLKSLAQLPNT